MPSISRRAAGAVVLLVTFLASACTPVQIAWWQDPSVPEEAKTAVREHMARPKADEGSGDCYEALDRHWPASSREWMRSIVWRESRNQPSAANPSSSARGCAQLIPSVHSGRFRKLGFSPSQWADPDVNIKVALDLYREAGTSPWRL